MFFSTTFFLSGQTSHLCLQSPAAIIVPLVMASPTLDVLAFATHKHEQQIELSQPDAEGKLVPPD